MRRATLVQIPYVPETIHGFAIRDSFGDPINKRFIVQCFELCFGCLEPGKNFFVAVFRAQIGT